MAKSTAATIQFDTTELRATVDRLGSRLAELPKGVAERIAQHILAGFNGGLLKVSDAVFTPAGGALDGVVRLRLVGLDELITAAFAANGERADFLHGDAP